MDKGEIDIEILNSNNFKGVVRGSESGPQCFILDTLYYRYVTNCELSWPVEGATHFHLQLGLPEKWLSVGFYLI